jgi:F-type H+-transporting ATPase subunit b
MLLAISSGTLIVQLINFIVFLVILNAIFLRPVGRAIAARRAYIDGVGSDIVQFEADVKALRLQADEKRAAARRRADAIVGEARAQAQSEAALIIADHQAQAAAIVAEAQATVGLELAQARTSEAGVIEALAREMLERAIGPEVAAR